jgi:hypothetical protein
MVAFNSFLVYTNFLVTSVFMGQERGLCDIPRASDELAVNLLVATELTNVISSIAKLLGQNSGFFVELSIDSDRVHTLLPLV